MTEINLEALGITKDDLIDRLIQKMTDDLYAQDYWDDLLSTRINKAVKEKVDAAVVAVGDATIGPRVEEIVDSLCLQETNKWGEKVGQSLTFKEYLISRAEAYMTEKVNGSGESQSESRDSYNWRGTQTRITAMIHKHLHYHIETAMKEALQTANSALAKGIQDAVEMKLKEITGAIKASVTVK
jgi:hypothetical protein